MYTINGKYVNALITEDSIEEGAIAQVVEVINTPIFDKDIVIQADGHQGAGCPVGLSAHLGPVLVPNLVGVNISAQTLN